MSRFQEEVSKYQASMDNIGIKYDADLFEKITKGCGPSIYNKDSSSVSCGDPKELDRVKQNYLIKKLGLEDSPKLDEAIQEVCEQMGKSNRNKYRAIFYYCLCTKFKKSSVYK